MDQLDIHPLQISLINCNIFEFLPFEEKKKWRALSRTFHDVTLKTWSKAIVFTLDESLNNQNGRILNNETSNESSKDPEEEMSLREVPISNFRLVTSKRVFPEFIRKYLPDPRWDFALFLERSGSALESLHIDATFRQYRFLDFFKLLLLKHCKNLKELSIRSYVILDMYPVQRFFDEEEEKALPEVAEGLKTLAVNFRNKIADTRAAEIEVCKGILSFVPNIKRLKLAGVGVTKLLTSLPQPLLSSDVSTPPRFVQLEDLEIDGLSDRSLDLILGFDSLRFYMKVAKPDIKRLRFINFSLHCIRYPSYYFHHFISDCKFTLTRLQLNFLGSRNTPLSCWISDLTGIDFQNLTHLVLIDEGSAEQSFGDYAPRFDFRALRGMKKLKVFRCVAKAMASSYGMPFQAGELEFRKEGDFEEFDWTKQVGARNKELKFGRESDSPLLEELEEFSFFLRERLSAQAVRQLGKWMPSVRKLGLIADRTLFPVLFEVWGKSLQKVVLLGPANVTEALIEEATQGKTVLVEVLGHEKCYDKFNEKIF